jgi:transcriptional regulator with XRE-family HTH domain
MNNIDTRKTGEFIRARRELLNLTQEELGLKLHRSNKSVSKWECGRSAPSADILADLAEALKCTEGEILSGKMENISDDEDRFDRFANLFWFHKTDKTKMMYEDLVYEFSDAEKIYNALFYIHAEEDFYECGHHGALTECADRVRVRETDEEKEYVRLETLLWEGIEKYDPGARYIEDYIHHMIINLWDQIYYSICDVSTERLKDMKANMTFFQPDVWWYFVDYEALRRIVLTFRDKYFDAIKKHILWSRS